MSVWSSDVCSSDLDALVKRVEADAVDEFGGVGDVPAREVARLAGLDRADFVRQAERGGGVHGDAAQCLDHGQSEQSRAHIEHQTQRGRRRGAGADRKSVVWGTGVSVRVDLGGSSIMKKKKNK